MRGRGSAWEFKFDPKRLREEMKNDIEKQRKNDENKSLKGDKESSYKF